MIASNRINAPKVVKPLLAAGKADLVSMARLLLVNPQFVAKAGTGRAEEINTCIVCDQACLDHTFVNRRTTCLANPWAAFKTELHYRKTCTQKRIVMIGVGPAGLSVACATAERGHRVSLFEVSGEIGGQFNLAKRIPSKGEFRETLRYSRVCLGRFGVDLRFSHRVCQGEPDGQFDDVVVAISTQSRRPKIDGIGGPTVLSYADVLRSASVGAWVVIVDADDIGSNVAAFLVAAPSDGQLRALGEWLAEWGVNLDNNQSGDLRKPTPTQSACQVWPLQRKPGVLGAQLGKTSGWVYRVHLRHNAVRMFGGMEHLKIDERGLLTRVDGEEHWLEVNNTMIRIGQEPLRESQISQVAESLRFHLIGGARVAGELDTKRVIHGGAMLAVCLQGDNAADGMAVVGRITARDYPSGGIRG